MSRARFRVKGVLDQAARVQVGIVTIERGASPVFIVRPLRRRRTYELPLEAVAKMVVERVVRAELFRARIERAARRKARRRR